MTKARSAEQRNRILIAMIGSTVSPHRLVVHSRTGHPGLSITREEFAEQISTGTSVHVLPHSEKLNPEESRNVQFSDCRQFVR
jgi:hypothetical protein